MDELLEEMEATLASINEAIEILKTQANSGYVRSSGLMLQNPDGTYPMHGLITAKAMLLPALAQARKDAEFTAIYKQAADRFLKGFHGEMPGEEMGS